MFIGIISDIHSNASALEKALKIFENRNIKKLYCLGDLIGYGKEPNEVINLVRKNNIICVMGNHEKLFLGGANYEKYNFLYTRKIITEDCLEYIKRLPEEVLINNGHTIMTHGFPGEIHRYFYANSNFDDMKGFQYERIFIGHTHYPMLASYYNKKIINPGSLGQSRDGNQRGSFLICDIENDFYEFMRI